MKPANSKKQEITNPVANVAVTHDIARMGMKKKN